jgi:hypothetical protein
MKTELSAEIYYSHILTAFSMLIVGGRGHGFRYCIPGSGHRNSEKNSWSPRGVQRVGPVVVYAGMLRFVLDRWSKYLSILLRGRALQQFCDGLQ